MKLSEKIQEALREQQEINLSDPAVQKRLAAQWGYVPAGAQPAPNFADAYQGAMEEAAIWKKRALEAEDLNRKFVAEINGPTYMGEPAQPAPSVPDATWLPVPDKHPTFDPVDLRLADGSVLCGCVPQSDGDYWWEGPSGEVFIDPRYAPVTHWRLSAAPEAKP